MHDRERRFAREEQIARLVCDAVPGVRFHRKTESPDAILIRDDGREIGLEVAGVVSEATLRTARLRDEACAAVEVERSSRNVSKWLRVYFDATSLHENPMSRGDRRRWLTSLGDVALDLATATPSGECGAETLYSRGVAHVVGLTWKPSTKPGVGTGWTLWGEHVLAAALLQKKDALLPTYREKHPQLTEIWIALEGIWPGMVDYGFHALGRDAFESGFTRVFVVKGERRGVDEVAEQVLPAERG